MLSPGRHICNLKISKSLTIRAMESEDQRAHTSTDVCAGGVVLVGVGNKAIVTINAPSSSSSSSSSCGGGASRDAGAVTSRYLLVQKIKDKY